jgi:hypothetical protein
MKYFKHRESKAIIQVDFEDNKYLFHRGHDGRRDNRRLFQQRVPFKWTDLVEDNKDELEDQYDEITQEELFIELL